MGMIEKAEEEYSELQKKKEVISFTILLILLSLKLNSVLENTLESAYNKKLAKINKEKDVVKTDLKHKL